jgi:hypothetical protein
MPVDKFAGIGGRGRGRSPIVAALLNWNDAVSVFDTCGRSRAEVKHANDIGCHGLSKRGHG